MGPFISVYGQVKWNHCKAVTVSILHSKWPHEHWEAGCGGKEDEKEAWSCTQSCSNNLESLCPFSDSVTESS